MSVKRRFLFLAVISFLVFFNQNINAGTTGKLAGTITDSETGELLPGVNVLLDGTFLGGSTDANGEYSILNIPPGIYTIKAMYIGYTTEIVQNIEINADRTTRLNFSLQPTILENADAIVIVAEKDIIQKDRTGSLASVGATDIEAMPVQSIDEVLNIQAGVVNADDGLHVRGGRTGETLFMVDGVSITDLDGGRGIDVETDAVQEMQLISGTFNAEYGKAMSGIVNIITKEGGDEYAGQIQAAGSSFLSGSNIYSVMKSYGPETDPSTGKTVMVDHSENPLTDIRPQYDVRGVLSGPVPFSSKKLSFFVSGRYQTNESHLYGRRWYTPQGLAGDSALVPLRSSESISMQGKVTFRPLAQLKIDYSFYYNYTDVDYSTDVLYRYVPESGRQRLSKGISQNISVNHALSDKTFYELKISNYYSDFESYLYDDPTLMPDYFIRITKNIDGEDQIEDVHYSTNAEKESILANARENGWSTEFVIDPENPEGFLSSEYLSSLNFESSSFRQANTPRDFDYSTDKFWLGKFDFTSQVTQNHLIKSGIEATFHELQREEFTLRPKSDSDGNEIVPFEPFVEPLSSIYHNMYIRKPVDFSAYVQDKMEFDQLVINVGLRLDYFDPDYIIPVDPTDPDIYNPYNPEWKGPDWDEDYYQNLLTADAKQAYAKEHSYTPDQRRKFMQKKVDPKVQLSPRIGIAYPISENGVIHFSYGHFFQMPEARYLYGVRPDYKLQISNQGQVFGNADLKAESTTQYEIGLQSRVAQGVGLDVTAFYKDIRDWVGISPLIKTKHLQTTRYAQYENKDYANVRGITLACEVRPTNDFAAMLDYTFQFAEGTYSNPSDAVQSLLNNEEPAKKLIYMDYDRRHSVNATLTYRLYGWVASLIGRYNTGLPYTPEPGANVVGSQYRGWRENIARRPSYSQVDLRVDKTLLHTGSFAHKLFIRMYNLFDQRGELNVFSDTGTAKYTTEGTHSYVSYNSNRIGSLEHFYLNPQWYQTPREIQVGYILNF